MALVTGANRGLGRAIVEALLGANVVKVYAGARDPKSLTVADSRVVPLAVDTSNAASIAAASAQVALELGALWRANPKEYERAFANWK